MRAIKNKLNAINTIFNFSFIHKGGTAILQTSNNWHLIQGEQILNGRAIIAKIKRGTHILNLVTLHAPSSQQYKRPEFYRELADKINLLPNRQNTIIIGDFNITLDDKDIVGNRGSARLGRKELQEIVDDLDLVDTFRILNPNKIDTTHTNTWLGRSARIDRAYVPSSVKTNVHKHLVYTNIFTDHTGILINLGAAPVKTFSSHWKFNDKLLDNEQFRESITDIINFTKHSTENINNTLDTFRKTV